MLFVYILGPYRGNKEENAKAFRKAAQELWAEGHWGMDPIACNSDMEGIIEDDEFIERDLQILDRFDCGLALPGWEESEGAQREMVLFNTLGNKVWLYPHLPPRETSKNDIQGSVTEEASKLVNGTRQSHYGHPLDDFSASAGIMSALGFMRRESSGRQDSRYVIAEDIPILMQAVKLSREWNTPKRDNRVDGCGYWQTLDMVLTERARRSANRSAQWEVES